MECENKNLRDVGVELNRRLVEVPMDRWPAIWWSLIRDEEWPKDLGEPIRCPSIKLDELRKRIEKSCGIKSCARYYNVVLGPMTDQMFEDWWDSAEAAKNEIRKKPDGRPERVGEDCTPEHGKRGERPIMTVLLSFFLGGIGGFLFRMPGRTAG